MGAVVEITTRMPIIRSDGRGLGATQNFKMYATPDNYDAYQLSANWAIAPGISLLAELQRIPTVTASRSLSSRRRVRPHPAMRARRWRAHSPTESHRHRRSSTSAPAGFEHQQEGNYKLKLAYDFSPALRGIYTVGVFQQDDNASVQSYITDAAGNPVYSGNLNIFGYNYNIPASSFSNNYYHLKEDLVAQSLVLRSSTREPGTGRGAQQLRLEQQYVARAERWRFPRPEWWRRRHHLDGRHRLVERDLEGFWRPHGSTGTNRVIVRRPLRSLRLASPKYLTDNWISGGQGALSADARGKTQTARCGCRTYGVSRPIG